MKYHFLIFSILSLFILSSCQDQCDEEEFQREVTERTDALDIAKQMFDANPENDSICEQYSIELVRRLRLYEVYEDCHDVNMGSIINSTVQSLENLNCG